MNLKQRIAFTLGIAVFVLMGLFPPYTDVRTSGGVHVGSGPGGRGDENSTERFHGYDFVLNGRDGMTMNGGRHMHYPNITLLCLHWFVLTMVVGLLIVLLGKPGASEKAG